MRIQLEIQDLEGQNLAMLAAGCRNVAILKAVMAEVVHTGVSKRVFSVPVYCFTFGQPSKNVKEYHMY